MSAKSRSSLFLMEMIIIILFFAFASAVCVGLFVQSHQQSEASVNLTNGLLKAQSAAEAYKHTEGDLARTAEILAGEIKDGALVQYFDQQWQPHQEDGVFTLTMNETGAALKTAEIVINHGQAEIYRLTVKVYQGGESQ